MVNYSETPLVYNESAQRFEFVVEDQLSLIEFKKRGDIMYLIHTEVPETLEGRGVAAAMVEKTMQYLDEHQLKLVPSCSYVQVFLKRHPEWERLLKTS